MAARSDRVPDGVAVLIGMGLVVATRIVRSFGKPANPIAALLLGSLPNFGAGLGIPFVVTSLISLFRQSARIGRQQLYMICVGSFLLLALWELIQFWAWAYPIDGNDVVASGIGAALAALLAGRIRR